MKVLIIGNGGREHAMAWKIAQNKNVEKIYCAPGNGGTYFENKCVNVDVQGNDALIELALAENIDLTVVGPEVPLVDGIVDAFKKKKLKIFGPARRAAMLEGSKTVSKDFMKKYGVKTAEYKSFVDINEATKYLEECAYPIVIKADGLAAGKGVVICEDKALAVETLKDFMTLDIFNGSGKKVVIEEYLVGVEASILSITDGETIIPFISAKDHKTIFENNQGPNTGGMGAIAPNPYCTKEVLEDFRMNILETTLEGIKKENMDYIGIIFFGVMITDRGCYLLEYNVRLGDPETQAVLPLMKSDFVELIEAALSKRLKEFSLEWYEEACCCIVASSGGYPGKYNKGYEISFLNDINMKFIAGAVTDKNGEKLLTSGGRVLAVVEKASTIEKAVEKAYKAIENVSFKDVYYRKDIGKIF